MSGDVVPLARSTLCRASRMAHCLPHNSDPNLKIVLVRSAPKILPVTRHARGIGGLPGITHAVRRRAAGHRRIGEVLPLAVNDQWCGVAF